MMSAVLSLIKLSYRVGMISYIGKKFDASLLSVLVDSQQLHFD
jgi:hypothetical protein